MTSPTSRLIDKIVALGPQPLLKREGYRKTARSFHRGAGEVIAVVNFQSSMWNSPSSARFTVNLSVAVPFFHEKLTGVPFPKNPGSAAPVITERIGLLTPSGLDHWWEVTPDTDCAATATDVTSALERYGLPFLDRHLGPEALATAVQNSAFLRTNDAIAQAIFLSYLGRREAARGVLSAAIASNTHAGFGNTLRLISTRLGFESAT